MSSPIWTPDALRSEAQSLESPAWRLVEAQHRVSTLKLVDSLGEQDMLETILDEAKPPVPLECRHLDYLLSTPFRYRPYPRLGIEFPPDSFADDPRLEGMVWNRPRAQ